MEAVKIKYHEMFRVDTFHQRKILFSKKTSTDFGGYFYTTLDKSRTLDCVEWVTVRDVCSLVDDPWCPWYIQHQNKIITSVLINKLIDMWRAAFFITICQYLIISWIIVLLSFMFPWSKVVGRKIIKGLVIWEKRKLNHEERQRV